MCLFSHPIREYVEGADCWTDSCSVRCPLMAHFVYHWNACYPFKDDLAGPYEMKYYKNLFGAAQVKKDGGFCRV